MQNICRNEVKIMATGRQPPKWPKRNLQQRIEAMQRLKIKSDALKPAGETKRDKPPYKGMNAQKILEHRRITRNALLVDEALRKTRTRLTEYDRRRIHKIIIGALRAYSRLLEKYGLELLQEIDTQMVGAMFSDPDIKKWKELTTQGEKILGKGKLSTVVQTLIDTEKIVRKEFLK